MTVPPASPDVETQDLEYATGLIAQAAALEPAFTDAHVREVLRHARGKHMVLRGDLNGRRAVFRLYTSDPAARRKACKAHWAEMQRVWPLMNSGPMQVCEPLACAPDAGLLAMAEVPGTPLLKLFWRSDPADRARWLDPVARWLRTYMDYSETDQPATPEGWATRAARATGAQPFGKLRRREAPILDEILRLVPLIEGRPWRVAIGHGDFHPNNLIAGDFPMLVGIDCGGSRTIPIYKDMARLLMHMGRRGMIPSGDMAFGVDRVGLAAFSEAFDLTERERGLILPFFLAVEALLRTETRNLPKARVRHACAMSEALLEDLRKVGR